MISPPASSSRHFLASLTDEVKEVRGGAKGTDSPTPVLGELRFGLSSPVNTVMG